VAGPSLPDAELSTVPEHLVPPAQSRVADTMDQLDAPGTVGAPELALEPGAAGAGGVAGCCEDPPVSPSAGASAGSSVDEVTVAFDVLAAVMIGVMIDAFGSVEEPEFVTA
jgi:hypothetical protein